MKKIFIIGIVFLLLLGTVIAISSFNNKEDTINEWNDYKIDRERIVDSLTLNSIIYTSNKECYINYETGKPYECLICFEYTYTYNEEVIIENFCMILPPDTEQSTDNIVVENKVRELINQNIPIKEIKYTERELTGGSLEIKI